MGKQILGVWQQKYVVAQVCRDASHLKLLSKVAGLVLSLPIEETRHNMGNWLYGILLYDEESAYRQSRCTGIINSNDKLHY